MARPTASGGSAEALGPPQGLVDARSGPRRPGRRRPSRPQSRSPVTTPLARVEIRAAWGAAQRARAGDGVDVGRAREAVGLVQQVQHQRDGRAGDHADDQGDLLASTAWRRPAGRSCRSCRLSLATTATAKTIERDEQGEGDQGRLGVGPARGAAMARQHQPPRPATARMADARDRAVGRADQPGHVAADRGHEEAGDDHVDQAMAIRSAVWARPAAPGPGRLQIRIGERDQAGQADPDHRWAPARRARCAAGSVAGLQPGLGGHGVLQARQDRHDQLAQGPDGRDADGAGADEAGPGCARAWWRSRPAGPAVCGSSGEAAASRRPRR